MIYGSERIPHLRPDNRPDLYVREPAPPVREDVQRPVVISGETRWGKTMYCVWLPSLGVRSNLEARIWVDTIPSMARVEEPLAWETVP